MLTSDLVDFLEGGLSLLVGTRDAELVPDCTRAMGVVVGPDRQHLTIYVPKITSAGVAKNLRDNGHIAVTFCRPIDHRTLQIKGLATVRDAEPDERLRIELYRSAFAVQLDLVGMPRRRTLQFAHWPAYALDIRITDLYTQTPGPGAGERLGAR